MKRLNSEGDNGNMMVDFECSGSNVDLDLEQQELKRILN